MGSWGPGALQNDHAQDLLSIECDRWRQQLDETLENADASWQDIEGSLVYVHLLTTVAGDDPGSISLQRRPPRGASSSSEIAQGWKERFLGLTSSGPYRDDSARQGRLTEVTRLFDRLIELSASNDAPAKRKAAPKARTAKK